MVCNTVLDFDCGTIHSIFHINLHEQFVLQSFLLWKFDLHELVFE